ncbi:MAG: hypothetical protein PHY15_02320 [Eubacteriales bacterium]|nr:hypothetical protein [Eubacteriales bacterium]MDD4474339.1 hypothetical protein [Eubacteriales bacterium]
MDKIESCVMKDAKISFCPSIALEVLCFIQKQSLDDTKWMDKRQIDEIKNINEQLPDSFSNRRIGMSTLSLILSTYTDNHLEDISIDDLITIFRKPSDISSVVRNRITNEYTASYVYPTLELLCDGWADKYIEKISIMKEIGFEQQYKTRILPLVQKEIEEKSQNIIKYNTVNLFNQISILKSQPLVEKVKIFVSFFSFPTAFTLYKGNFLTCFTANDTDFFSLIAHEQMHGFACSETIELYKQYVAQDSYLTEMHKHLIDDMQSGDEEEMVMAAEYYLCLLAGSYTKEKLLQYAKTRYNGYCPTSVILFHLLSEEAELPSDYNKWLINKFQTKQLPQNNIPEYLDQIR